MDRSRFEISLPAEQRRSLDELAKQIGLSRTALTRLALARLLNEPESLLGRKPGTTGEAVAT